MKNVFKSPKTYMLAGLLIIVVTASAWQLKDKKHPANDTTAANNAAADTANPRQHDTDQDEYGMKGFDEAMKQLNVELKNIDFNFKGLDTTINNSVRLALAGIDFAKIGKEASDAVNKIDWKELQNTINTSIKEAQEQVKNIDWGKINVEIKQAQEEVNRELKNELGDGKLQKIIDDAMKNANEGLGEARQELRNWKDFTNGLEQDGLIDKKKGYKIEWKSDGSLYVNGNKQPKETADKYHKYCKEGGYTISNDGNETESL